MQPSEVAHLFRVEISTVCRFRAAKFIDRTALPRLRVWKQTQRSVAQIAELTGFASAGAVLFGQLVNALVECFDDGLEVGCCLA